MITLIPKAPLMDRVVLSVMSGYDPSVPRASREQAEEDGICERLSVM